MSRELNIDPITCLMKIIVTFLNRPLQYQSIYDTSYETDLFPYMDTAAAVTDHEDQYMANVSSSLWFINYHYRDNRHSLLHCH